MDTIRRIAKNSLVYLTNQIASKILAVIFGIYLARYLGVMDFGRLCFALSFTALASMFIQLGLEPLTIREVARDKEKTSKYLSGMLIIKSIATFPVIILSFFILHALGYPVVMVKLVSIIGLSMILDVVASVSFIGIFRAYQRLDYEALTDFLKSFILASVGFTFIYLGYGVIAIALVYLLASLTQAIVAFLIYIRKIAKFRFRLDFPFFGNMFRRALPFGLTFLAGTFVWKVDVVMLSKMQGDTAVGIYSAATKLTDALLAFCAAYGLAVYPVLSIFFGKAQESLRIGYEKSIKLFLIMGIPLAIGTTLLAPRIISLIYGQEYGSSALVLKIIIWFFAIWSLRAITAIILRAINKPQLDFFANVVGLILNIALNLILIPRYSYIGAAIATVGTELLIFGTHFYFVSRRVYRLPIHRMILSPLLSSVAMGIFIYYFKDHNLFFVILSSMFIYFVVLFLFKGFSKDEIAFAKRVVRPSG